MQPNPLEVLMRDMDDNFIDDWDDFCEMMDGISACERGEDIDGNRSEEWQYGWKQAYQEGEREVE